MTIKTHAFLATTATLVLIALIYYRSNSGDDSRLRKVMEKTKDLPAAVAANPVSKPEAKKSEVPKTEAPKTEIPEAEEPVVPVKTEKAAAPVKKAPVETVEKPNDDFFVDQNLVINNSFKDGLRGWRFWRTNEENGKKLIKAEDSLLSIKGQINTLMGVAQSVKVESGTVYRLSAKVRSKDPEEKSFMGARLALYADGQKEQQVVWLYKNKDWEEKSLTFTNRYSGSATLFVHTGYTTNAAECLVKDIALLPENPFPRRNVCSFNGDFKDGTKGWDFWHISGTEASNLIERTSGDYGSCVIVKGQPGSRLMGMSQAVSVVSGAVYRMSANVKSQDVKERSFFGARVAFYAPGQKEHQLLWTYATKDWEEKILVFTNNYSGKATFFFHTGYTTNACTAMFKDLSLIKRN
ncbi:carbohydrate binding domain-containing protein [bacterium]|nr:carbohydrate binding domain-containing protein [bacterium]